MQTVDIIHPDGYIERKQVRYNGSPLGGYSQSKYFWDGRKAQVSKQDPTEVPIPLIQMRSNIMEKYRPEKHKLYINNQVYHPLKTFKDEESDQEEEESDQEDEEEEYEQELTEEQQEDEAQRKEILEKEYPGIFFERLNDLQKKKVMGQVELLLEYRKMLNKEDEVKQEDNYQTSKDQESDQEEEEKEDEEEDEEYEQELTEVQQEDEAQRKQILEKLAPRVYFERLDDRQKKETLQQVDLLLECRKMLNKEDE